MGHAQLYSLISSLPYLCDYTNVPLITRADFLNACGTYLDNADLETLTKLTLIPDPDAKFPAGSLAEKYTRWETALRHSITRLRLVRHRGLTDAGAAREVTFETDAEAAAAQAFASGDPMEREKILDSARWAKLDEWTVGHQFDMDALYAYAIRLQIAEKWSARSADDAEGNLSSAINAVYGTLNDENK